MHSRLYFSRLGNVFLQRHPAGANSFHSHKNFNHYPTITPKCQKENKLGERAFGAPLPSLQDDHSVNSASRSVRLQHYLYHKSRIHRAYLGSQSLKHKLKHSAMRWGLHLGLRRIKLQRNRSANIVLQKRQTLEESATSPTDGYEVNRAAKSGLKVVRSDTGKWKKSPLTLLAYWRDSRPMDFPDQLYKNEQMYATSLPTILTEHLYFKQYKETSIFQHSRFSRVVARTLESQGLGPDDVVRWAWVLSPSTNEEAAERFLSSENDNPMFLLLEILRRDVSRVKTLKHLLKYSWELVISKSLSKHTASSGSGIKMQTSCSIESVSSSHEKDLRWQDHILSENAMLMLWTRLLRLVLLRWPAALVSLAHMVRPIMLSTYGFGPNDQLVLDSPTHKKACRLFNIMIHRLSIPATIEPHKSMIYNWTAQKVLLSLAEDFTPPLVLSRSSYRSIAQVLTLQKKSDMELKVVRLQKRSWPPWRMDQDGMDARRPHDADHSRAVSVLMRAKDSGFQLASKELSLMIMGGQEPDGTPTIQSRDRTWHGKQSSLTGIALRSNEWAAKIFATRDVQEAWSAFSRFQERGGKPSSFMYYAMLQKVEYDLKRFRGRYDELDVLPGNGKEVLAPANDNFTAYYQQSLQPPTKDDLYNQMLEQGHRPAGGLLNFLIRNARTPDQAFQYLQDSGMNQGVIEFLTEAKVIEPEFLKHHLRPSTLTAFLSFICRFAPRAVSDIVDDQGTPLDAEVSSDVSKSTKKMTIVEFKGNVRWSSSSPLRLALDLLRLSHSQHRPAWYVVFRVLGYKGVIINRKYAGQALNDILAWRISEATLSDFHSRGMELDPLGFLFICKGLEKAFWATQELIKRRRIRRETEREHGNLGEKDESKRAPQANLEDKASLDLTSSKLQIMKEFWAISKSSEADEVYHIPTLLHSIGGVHIHAYVRIVGIMEDHTEILNVLKWMAYNHTALQDISLNSNNGSRMFRKALVAMKTFLHDTEHEAEAKELIDNAGIWGGWPSADEAQEYARWALDAEYVNKKMSIYNGITNDGE